ncbi:DUF4129 domain-containing protein [Streptomyces hypolithicus]
MSTAGGRTTARLWARTNDDVPVDTPRIPAREAAERELSEPKYHENDPNLLERALDRFWEWVGGLFDAASEATPGGAVGVVAVVVLVVLLAVAVWLRLGTPQRSPSAGDALFAASPRSAAEHRAVAEAHADRHRWSQAVQERMRAIVRALEERALLDPRPGRTADEAAEEGGRSLPVHAPRLRAAAREFDDVTYGGRTADEQSYQRLSALDSDLSTTKPVLDGAAEGVGT